MRLARYPLPDDRVQLLSSSLSDLSEVSVEDVNR